MSFINRKNLKQYIVLGLAYNATNAQDNEKLFLYFQVKNKIVDFVIFKIINFLLSFRTIYAREVNEFYEKFNN
jgi:hypothetical protein